MTNARYVHALLLNCLDEIEELQHVNAYNIGTIFNARHYTVKAIAEIEKLMYRDEPTA